MHIREQVLTMQPICVHCKAVGEVALATEVDHIVPLSKGGSDALDNLQALCKQCHSDKTRRDLGQVEKPAIGLNGYPKGWA
jgi:5-methylcytosine-specific restriction enzyme A